MKELTRIDTRINHIIHELIELKKALIHLKIKGRENNKAWNDLMAVSDEITKLWQEKSAAEEIRDQRKKVW